MKKRIAVVAFFLTMAITSTALADLSLGMGTRWTATRWYNPVWAGDVVMSGNHMIMNSESALDGYFMIAFNKKFGVYLQIDYLSMSWACTSADSDDECTGRETGDMGFSSFGFELGMKYYFAEPRRAAISPMLTAGFFKYFASVTDGDAPTDDQFALGDLSSPIGGRLAIGVEYNFSNNFSIGAEIFGLKLAYASTSTVEETGNDRATIVAADSDTNYFAIDMYTAITLNFRFYGLFRVYTREEEDQAQSEEREDRTENQQFQQQQQQWNQQGQQQQPNQQWNQQQQQPNQQWQQQQQPNQQWNQQQQPNQQWQQQQTPQDPNQQWQQPQGGTTPTQ